MTRQELTAAARFQQSMTAIARDPSRRSPYGLRAESGTLGARDPKTGDHTFTDSAGVTAPVRNLKGAAYPTDHDATAVQVVNGQNYAR